MLLFGRSRLWTSYNLKKSVHTINGTSSQQKVSEKTVEKKEKHSKKIVQMKKKKWALKWTLAVNNIGAEKYNLLLLHAFADINDYETKEAPPPPTALRWVFCVNRNINRGRF